MEAWIIATLISFGIFQGLNPVSGWLLAAAHGARRQTPCAVLSAVIPLAIGQSAAVGAVLILAMFALPVRWPAGIILMILGTYRLFATHPRDMSYAGDGLHALAVRSFLTAFSRGAGLMALAVGPLNPGEAVVVHGFGYFIATSAAASLCFARLGLGLLRKTWGTLDILWAAALFAAGAMMVLA